MENESRKINLYKRRLKKERSISENEIQKRMNWNLPILSENPKCSISLDLPVINCKPTKICAEVCYACQGRQFYKNAIIKSLAVNRMSLEDPDKAAWHMAREAKGRQIRLAGSGELLPSHKPLADCLERYGASWWGFTRRTDSYEAMPRLMFSLDASTRPSVLEFVRENVPKRRRSYLYRPGDPPPLLEVAVTFPLHGPLTNYASLQRHRKTDCPSVRGWVDGCWECGRCYIFYP